MLRLLTALAAVVLLSLAAPARAQDIDTRAAATTVGYSFGYPDTSAYGQTFTVPAGEDTVSAFGFRLFDVPATTTFRAYLMAWDDATQRPTGTPLYASGDLNTSGATQQDVLVTIPGGAPVAAGQRYVIFFATNEASPGGTGSGGWAKTPSDVYPDGGSFYYNGGGQPFSVLTSNQWTDWGQDFGFAVTFAAAAVPAVVPTLTEWAMILLAMLLAGATAIIVSRRRLSL